jgi:beta-fructofuranosidase
VDEVKDLKILADRSSVEVFVNDGEYVFSTRYYPENHKLLAEAVEAQIRLSEIM